MLDFPAPIVITKDHLLEAGYASLRHVGVSDEATALRDHLLPLLCDARQRSDVVAPRRPSASATASHRQTLDAILADLILASGNLEALGFCYRSMKRTDFTGDKTKASSRVYEWQLKALHHLGLVEVYIGFTKYGDFDGTRVAEFKKATRIRATADLLQTAQEYGITRDTLYQHYALEKSSNHQPVIVRAGKAGSEHGKIIPHVVNPNVIAVQRKVERINTIYDQHQFEGMPQPQVYRGFNMGDAEGFAFNKGGRLYGAFQQMSPESRRAIRINGKPVVELDLKAAHLTILYHITDTPVPKGDLYAIDGLPRPVVKAVITAMTGKGKAHLTMWTQRMRDRIAEDTGDGTLRDPDVLRSRYPVKKVAERIVAQHPPLLRLSPGKLDWADLQYLESQALIDAILKLGELHEVPALPLHDSIIVPAEDEEVSRWYLGDAFTTVTGGQAVIERK